MFKERLRRITIFRSKSHKKLTWSLQPIVLWLQILGMPTSRSPSSVVRRITVLVVGAVIMIWVVSSRIYKIIGIFQTPTNLTFTRAELWILTLNQFNDHLSGILISLNLIIVCHLKWKLLWKNVCEIEQRLKFADTDYGYIRKMSATALLLLLMVNKSSKDEKAFKSFFIWLDYWFVSIDDSCVCFLCYQETTLPFFKCYYGSFLRLPMAAMILEVGYWISCLYPSTAIILFMCLAWVASMMLQRLIDELPTNLIPFHSELNQELVKWKRDYRSISDYIEKINHFFGFILLAFLATILINFVTYIFWLIKCVQQGNFFYENVLAFLIFKNVIYALFLIMISHRIKQKVSNRISQTKFCNSIVCLLGSQSWSTIT